MVDQAQTASPQPFLPAGWNPNRDLVCVVGQPCEGFFEYAAEHGVRNLIVFIPAGAPAFDVPKSTVLVRTQLELMDAVQRLAGGVPQHIELKRWDRVHVTDALLLEIQRALKEDLVHKQLGQDTIDAHGGLWAGRVLENLFHLASVPSIANLAGAFEGVPCFLVAPGPSLEKNIEELRRVRGRALIVCTSHALRPLQQAGCRADLVIAADPGKLLTRHFHGVDTSEIGALVLSSVSEGGQFELPGTRVFSFESHPQIHDWLFGGFDEQAYLATGGSVACSALSLALRMGCDPISFVGQDLAFSGDKYYTGSTYDGNSKIALAEDGKSFVLERDLGTARQADEAEVIYTAPTAVFEVPGHDGEPVLTSYTLRQFLHWIQAVAKAASAEVRINNCTEGGALIEGAQHVPLAEVVDGLPDIGLDVDAVLEARTEGHDRGRRRTGMADRIDEMITSIRDCLAAARSCMKLVARAEGDAAAMRKLDREEKRLSRSLEPMLPLALVSQKRIREAVERGAEATTQGQALAAARQLYEVVIEGGLELGPILRTTRERFDRLPHAPPN